MPPSRLDAVYRSFLITKFFTKGWGKPENLRRIFEFRKVVSNRDECFKLIDRDYLVTITKEETSGDCRLIEGYFKTPFERYLPGIVPLVAQNAYFQALVPLTWRQPDFRPMCLHLAGTGDHYFWRRRQWMAKPLLKEANIGAIILENPFYGKRKPSDQVRSSLHNVSDIFVMGGCLILESLVLMHWCERNGLGPLGISGLSMGGHMASLAATNWPKPLVLVPCLSWSTASAVFLQGVMSRSINWDLLEDQYLSDGVYRNTLKNMVTVVDSDFLAGKKFAKKATQSVENNITNELNQSKLDLHSNTNKKDAQKEANNKNIESIIIKENNHTNNLTIDATSNKSHVENKYDNLSTKAELDSENAKLKLKSELQRLSENRVISRSLYNKLSSNEKFVLDSKEVAELNKLNADVLPGIDSKLNTDTNVTSPVATNTTTASRKSEQFNWKSASSPGSTDQSKPKSRDLNEVASELLVALNMKSTRKIDIDKIHWRDREALQFMRGIMDECTHLSNFTVPYDTSLIIAVCAKHDAYVPRHDVGTLEEIWPGAEVRYLDAGHISAYLLHHSLFRSCIAEAFERSRRKWKDGKHIV